MRRERAVGALAGARQSNVQGAPKRDSQPIHPEKIYNNFNKVHDVIIWSSAGTETNELALRKSPAAAERKLNCAHSANRLIVCCGCFRVFALARTTRVDFLLLRTQKQQPRGDAAKLWD